MTPIKHRIAYAPLLCFLLVSILVACKAPPASLPAGENPQQAEASSTTQSQDASATAIAQATTSTSTTPAGPATPTSTIAASATLQPTTTAEPTPTSPPTPTPTIPGLIGPTEYADNVNPLTGETVPDPAVLDRRPIAIKISNYPPLVRPQAGLNNADLVFEHYAEGVTRFTAVFYSKDAEPVGSIRSGRLIDLEIPMMYDAAFAYSGSAAPVRLMFRESPFFERIVSPDFAHGGFYRVEAPDRAIEHTLFTNTYNLRFILDERGQNTAPEYAFGMSFHPDPPAGGTPANSVEVQYLATNAFWQYNTGSRRYTRWTDGEPHVDANTEAQLNFRNIIVVAAHHEDTDILEDLVGGGHHSIQIQLWGEGPVTIFRDGQRYDGTWRRATAEDMLTFYDSEGRILPLAPGNSFFQVVPLGFENLYVRP